MNLKRLSRRQFGMTSLAALAAGCGQRGGDDFILHGGSIYTGVFDKQRVEAVRIRDGRFVFVGSLADAQNERGARLIDLGGASAFPGFCDGHVHLMYVGLQAMQLDLVGVESIAALQERLRTYAAEHPTGPIVGRGWIETHWPERRFPTRADLDAVVSDRPVVLGRIDGHATVVNSAALALAGIDDTTANPEGGSITRDARGAATGMLIDNAAALVESRMPAPSLEMRRDALRQAAQLYAQRGWTGVANMSTSAEEEGLFRALAGENALPLHADIYLDPASTAVLREDRTDANALVQVRGVKLYMDGALGSRGAALLAPYSDERENSGLMVTPIESMREQMERARQGRYQVAAHAIGDRGNRMVLDAFRDTFADNPELLRAARWRIEHAQVLSPEDIPRFARMSVIASMQPSHAISDLHFAPSRLGADRLAGAYAWASLLRSGAVVAGGSDAPVEKGDPLIEFYAAAYRHDLHGFAGPDWHGEQAVSRHDALRMLSWGPAFAAFQELERGTIEVGKKADVSVFSADLMEAPPAEIPTATPMLTIADGRITHTAL
jgi:predicted amidohydrolase YtcJ